MYTDNQSMYQLWQEQLHTSATKKSKQQKEYVLVDINGLRLRITPNGIKRWLINYKDPISQKRTNYSVGAYPVISLAKARKIAMEIQELIALGKSPVEERQISRRQQQSQYEHTFYNIAAQWFELKKDSVTEDYATDI